MCRKGRDRGALGGNTHLFHGYVNSDVKKKHVFNSPLLDTAHLKQRSGIFKQYMKYPTAFRYIICTSR
jgi:hypothetical protein